MEKYKEITATWARETSTAILGVKLQEQLTECFEAIKNSVSNNSDSVTVDLYADNLTIKELEKRGFTVKTVSDQRDGSFTTISWCETPLAEEPVVEFEKKKFYKDGIIGKGLMSEESYKEYVESIIARFENVCWGGNGCEYFSTDFTDVVVVYQAGVRGPADWYYLNKEHRWAHGGYTGYKETYSNSEFLEMISRILEQNKKYK